MTVVAVTSDPNLSVALSLRGDLGGVEIVTDRQYDPTTTDAAAVIIDLSEGSSPELVQLWRQRRPEIPIILVGDTDRAIDVPNVHRMARPLSLDGLAAMLRELTSAAGDDDPRGETSWVGRILSPFRRRRGDGGAGRRGEADGEGERGERGNGGQMGGADPARRGPASPPARHPDADDEAGRSSDLDGGPTDPPEQVQGRADSGPKRHAATNPARSIDPDESVGALRHLIAESNTAGRLDPDPGDRTPRQHRRREPSADTDMPAELGTGDAKALARATIDRIDESLGAETVIVWRPDERCMYVEAALGLSEMERCVTVPLDHPILRALETRDALRLPARDLIHSIPGLSRLMSHPAQAVAVRRDHEIPTVVLVSDPSLLPSDLELIESIVRSVWP